MDGKIVPEGLGFRDPVWENVFDNQVAVQFIHRILAFVIVALTFFILMNRNKFNRLQKRGIHYLAAAVSIQFILGVMTLLTQVNIPLALIHQAGAFLLFSVCVYLLFLFRRIQTVKIALE
jgi:cytochrome c oxidase assembly protein subunit 15